MGRQRFGMSCPVWVQAYESPGSGLTNDAVKFWGGFCVGEASRQQEIWGWAIWRRYRSTGEQHRRRTRVTLALALSHVLEDASDDIGFGHDADHAQLSATAWTPSEIDIEDPFESGHPAHRRRRGSTRGLGVRGAGALSWPGHDEVAVLRMGRKQAVMVGLSCFQ